MSRSKRYDQFGFYSAEIEQTFFVGNQLQINAGLGVLCQALSDQKHGLSPMDYKILVYGPSGSGKSSYPEGLAKSFIRNKHIAELIESESKKGNTLDSKLTLFHVKCNHLITSLTDEASLKRVLSDLEGEIMKSSPAMVAFDELDAFSPERMKTFPSSHYLFFWTMSFMQKSKRGLIILGILNVPKILEEAVMSQMDNLFRFRELEPETVEAILQHRGIPFAEQIALKMCTSTSVVVLGNELKNACEKAVRVLGHGDLGRLARLDSAKIADFMMLWLHTTWDQMDEYVKGNADYNDKADNSMVFWSRQYEDFLKRGL